MEEIKKELIELKFDINRIGCIFWIEAVRIIKEEPLEMQICKIYKMIADRYKTTSHAVESAMRKAIEPVEKNIQKKYGYTERIKNKTFLNLIRLELI